MTVEYGAAADIVTGALVGRTVEHDAGEGRASGRGGHDDALCLNCGTRLIGEHCHACGQASHVHRSLGAIAHEIGHGVFHFEGKIWRTLPMLILHPGTLTRRYVHGERARFVSPLALFLFTVFLMFATISVVGGEFSENLDEARSQFVRAETTKQIKAAQTKLAGIATERTRAVEAGRPVAQIDARASRARNQITALEAATQSGSGASDAYTFTNLKTKWRRLDHGIEKANKNPGLMIYKLQSSAYKYSWGLIPLSVPFVALLFLWRRRYHLYDHAIFVTYSIAFMMLLTIVLMLGGLAGLSSDWITFAAFVAPPVHMFAQLRGAYELRKWSAAWRTVLLLSFAFTVLTTFVVLLLLHGLTD